MKVGFGLTSDPALLAEMFSVCFESICDFLGGNFQIISEIVDREQQALSRDSHVEKWNLVSGIVSKVPPLVVFQGPSTAWVWLSVEKAPAMEQIVRILRKHPTVHMATGELNQGGEGFRKTHFQALEVPKLLSRLRSDKQLVSFEQVRLIGLMTHERKATELFMTSVLGDLRQKQPKH
jgi:hypothetical protein